MLSHASVRQHATDTTTIIIIKCLSCKALCAQICQSDTTLLAQSLLLLLTLSKSRPYLDKLQLEVLRHVVVLAHPEDDGDDVLGRVTQAPQVSHHLVRFVDAAVDAVLQHVFDQNWVGLVTHLHIQPGSLLMMHRGWEFAHYTPKLSPSMFRWSCHWHSAAACLGSELSGAHHTPAHSVRELGNDTQRLEVCSIHT